MISLLNLTALALTSVALAEVSAAGEQLLSRIVAVVNDDVVLLDEVAEAVTPLLARLPADLSAAERSARVGRLRSQVLETLVADKLLEQQVQVLKLEVTKHELDKLITDLREQNGLDEEQFKAALAGQGMTPGEYRKGMRKQLLKMKIINLKVRSKVQVSDQDIQSRYQRQRAEASRDVRYGVRHIVFLVPEGAAAEVDKAALAKARAAAARLDAGADFAELARQISEGPSAKDGGDLGFFRPGDMVEAFEKAALALAPGEISAPVRTPFGWHLIVLVARKSGDLGELQALEAQLREQLYQEEIEVAFGRYIEELKREAHIELRLDESFADEP